MSCARLVVGSTLPCRGDGVRGTLDAVAEVVFNPDRRSVVEDRPSFLPGDDVPDQRAGEEVLDDGVHQRGQGGRRRPGLHEVVHAGLPRARVVDHVVVGEQRLPADRASGQVLDLEAGVVVGELHAQVGHVLAAGGEPGAERVDSDAGSVEVLQVLRAVGQVGLRYSVAALDAAEHVQDELRDLGDPGRVGRRDRVGARIDLPVGLHHEVDVDRGVDLVVRARVQVARRERVGWRRAAERQPPHRMTIT